MIGIVKGSQNDRVFFSHHFINELSARNAFRIQIHTCCRSVRACSFSFQMVGKHWSHKGMSTSYSTRNMNLCILVCVRAWQRACSTQSSFYFFFYSISFARHGGRNRDKWRNALYAVGLSDAVFCPLSICNGALENINGPLSLPYRKTSFQSLETCSRLFL